MYRAGIITADLPPLEFAEDREAPSVVVVARLRQVIELLQGVRVGPRIRHCAGCGRAQAAVVKAELHRSDELVAAHAIRRSAQRIIDEGGAAEAVVRVLRGTRGRHGGRAEQGCGESRRIGAQDLIVEVAHHAEDLLGSIVVTAVHVAGLRVPEVEVQHGDQARAVVARGLCGRGSLSAALEEADAVFEMVRQEETVGLEAEVPEDGGIALQNRRVVDVRRVDAQVRGRRLRSIARQGQQDAAAAQPEGVGKLDLCIRVENYGRHEALDAAGGIGFAEGPRLEQDVEVDVLDDGSGREETAAAAVEILGVCTADCRARQPVLRGLVPGLNLSTESEPGVLGQLDLTRRT